MTEWRTVSEFPAYEVSSMGQLRRADDGRILRCPPDRTGRARFTFSVHCRKTYRNIYRLVAIAFHGPPATPQSMACHINGDHTDDRAANLYWGDAKSNRIDAIRHGVTVTGSRFSKAQRQELRQWAAKPIPAAQVAERFGCTRSYVGYVRAQLRAS